MNKKIIIYLLSLFIIFSCHNHKNDNSANPLSENLDMHIDANQMYFPVNLFLDTTAIGLDTIRVKWYSKHLFALKEPLIFNDSSKKQIFRFLWLRSFNNPISIRIEKQQNTYKLYWKVSSGAGGYEPGKLVMNKSKSINKVIWDEFISEITKADFWSLKTNEEFFGLDGSRWILEGRSTKAYHVVDRWTPDVGSDYFNCCNFLINQTDLNISGADKY